MSSVFPKFSLHRIVLLKQWPVLAAMSSGQGLAYSSAVEVDGSGGCRCLIVFPTQCSQQSASCQLQMMQMRPSALGPAAGALGTQGGIEACRCYAVSRCFCVHWSCLLNYRFWTCQYRRNARKVDGFLLCRGVTWLKRTLPVSGPSRSRREPSTCSVQAALHQAKRMRYFYMCCTNSIE